MSLFVSQLETMKYFIGGEHHLITAVHATQKSDKRHNVSCSCMFWACFFVLLFLLLSTGGVVVPAPAGDGHTCSASPSSGSLRQLRRSTSGAVFSCRALPPLTLEGSRVASHQWVLFVCFPVSPPSERFLLTLLNARLKGCFRS